MPTPNTEALRDVVEVLNATPEDKFNIWTWSDGGCGTVGCAVGNFCMARPASGLRLDRYGVPVFGGERGWEAVEKFFALSEDDCSELFCGDYYTDDVDHSQPKEHVVTRQMVIDRIESFIDSHA